MNLTRVINLDLPQGTGPHDVVIAQRHDPSSASPRLLHLGSLWINAPGVDVESRGGDLIITSRNVDLGQSALLWVRVTDAVTTFVREDKQHRRRWVLGLVGRLESKGRVMLDGSWDVKVMVMIEDR